MNKNEIKIELLQSQTITPDMGKNFFRLTEDSYSTKFPWALNQFMSLSFQSTIRCLVVYYETQLIGYAIFSIVPPESELHLIVVGDDFKRQGIATLIFEELDTYLEHEKVDSLFLEVRKSNIAAIQFYEKNYFEKIDERKNYYTNPIEDAWIMMKNFDSEGSRV